MRENVILNVCPKCHRPMDDHLWRSAETLKWYPGPKCPGGPLSVVDPVPKG